MGGKDRLIFKIR